ncbi:Acyl-CoA N-acyltransferase [Penicillium digitatum]|uniref:Acyl-CoA N-acyltransferase n=1 Tax=Penicillium digitatum TaxID=36651 RepID=A0A7T6XGU2_PENDI|nr:Acyl-CoA N-acyltransferase [Penicillium digitatum]
MARLVKSPCLGDQKVLEPVTSLGQLTDIATKDFEITSALKLIAVSVTQQRFLVAKHLVIHPVTLTLVALGFANSVNAIYHDPCGWPYISVISTTVVLAILGIVIHLMWKYNTEAEKVGALNWLYGHDPDASAVTNQEDPAFNSDDGVTNVPTGENYDAFIRAWTVQQSFRGYGVGAALLNEAVKNRCEHKWKRLRFANFFANSLRVPPCFLHFEMDQEIAM